MARTVYEQLTPHLMPCTNLW